MGYLSISIHSKFSFFLFPSIVCLFIICLFFKLTFKQNTEGVNKTTLIMIQWIGNGATPVEKMVSVCHPTNQRKKIDFFLKKISK